MKLRYVAFATAMSLGMLTSPLTLAGLNDGLMAHYPFDGNAQDAGPNGNHGAVEGATLTADRFGKANSAYRFDGKDDSIVVPSSASLHPADRLSFAFWMKIEGITNTWSPIIFKGSSKWTNNGMYREYTVWLSKQLTLYLTSAGNQSAQQVLKSSAVKGGEWFFYAAVIDRRHHSIKVYINGRLDQEMADSYSSFKKNNNNLVFGGRGEGIADFSPLKGVLDDIRFYKRALSVKEIKELYTEKPPVVEPPVVEPPVVKPPVVEPSVVEPPPVVEPSVVEPPPVV
ncbi:MAG TPA: LamG domain-containing protein, partial [Thioploca sp.]|nr:LamG domain-containing protein [Thioploca sp.]